MENSRSTVFDAVSNWIGTTESVFYPTRVSHDKAAFMFAMDRVYRLGTRRPHFKACPWFSNSIYRFTYPLTMSYRACLSFVISATKKKMHCSTWHRTIWIPSQKTTSYKLKHILLQNIFMRWTCSASFAPLLFNICCLS